MVYRNPNHPKVNTNTQSTIDPPEKIDVHTATDAVVCVLCPIVVYWFALEDRDYDERYAVGDVEDSGAIQKTPCPGSREDGEIK